MSDMGRVKDILASALTPSESTLELPAMAELLRERYQNVVRELNLAKGKLHGLGTCEQQLYDLVPQFPGKPMNLNMAQHVIQTKSDLNAEIVKLRGQLMFMYMVIAAAPPDTRRAMNAPILEQANLPEVLDTCAAIAKSEEMIQTASEAMLMANQAGDTPEIIMRHVVFAVLTKVMGITEAQIKSCQKPNV